MTRRERLEGRAERRREWAEGRAAKSAAAFNRAHALTEGIPLGQPILVGHHSEKRHRRVLERSDNAMRAGCDSADMASHHASKAGGIEDQLARSIFSDDENAVEALEAKAAGIDAECETMKRANAAFKSAARGSSDPLRAGLLAVEAECGPEVAKEAARNLRVWSGVGGNYGNPFPSYCLTNRRANARRLRERIKDVKRRQERADKAEALGVLIEGAADYVSITFPEKPARSVLEDLRAADFRWSGGSWCGYRSKLPASVLALAERGGS